MEQYFDHRSARRRIWPIDPIEDYVDVGEFLQVEPQLEVDQPLKQLLEFGGRIYVSDEAHLDLRGWNLGADLLRDLQTHSLALDLKLLDAARQQSGMGALAPFARSRIGDRRFQISNVPLAGQLIDLRGHHEVAFGQAIDLMRPELKASLTPGEINIRMMPLLLGKLTYAVHKIEGLPEIGKGIRLVKVVLINDVPARNLIVKRLQLSPFKRRHAALAGNARFAGECGHDVSSHVTVLRIDYTRFPPRFSGQSSAVESAILGG